MAMLDHWHPVYPARQLRDRPIGITVAGQPIVLYRDQRGSVAALADACPHRRMKLSIGTVVGDRLRCRYHGWTYDRDGHGESPGTPKLHACTRAFEAATAHEFIWVKSRESRPQFPKVEAAGYVPIAPLVHDVPTPLETALDNFTEIEHSATTHRTFGYDLDRMHEVDVRFEWTDTSVRVINVGPTMRIHPLFRFLIGIRDGDLFHDDWTTYFSPVYSVYDHWWTRPDRSREALVRWRLYIFFTPVDEMTTRLTTFSFVKSRWPLGPNGGVKPFLWLLRGQIDEEIRRDIDMLRHLSDPSPSLEGMKLSRFDKVLGLNRERIERIYRGRTLTLLPAAS